MSLSAHWLTFPPSLWIPLRLATEWINKKSTRQDEEYLRETQPDMVSKLGSLPKGRRNLHLALAPQPPPASPVSAEICHLLFRTFCFSGCTKEIIRNVNDFGRYRSQPCQQPLCLVGLREGLKKWLYPRTEQKNSSRVGKQTIAQRNCFSISSRQ